MSVDKNVPEVRFKGFNKEWNHLTLGENAKFTKGQGYSKGDLVASGAPIILYGRLYTKYQTVITSVDTFVTEKDKSVKSMGGEVIVPASGESPEDISRASVVSEQNVILGGDLNIVLPNKKIHSTFLALAISNGRLKKELSSKAQGKSVVHIRNSDLADLDLILPTEYIEQTKIGNYFQTLDSLINQHQQKHDKLSSIKKSMLEKMFPKQGETIPEIRFKGFRGEWNYLALGENAKFTKGQGYSKGDLVTSGSPIILYGRLYTRYQTVITVVDTFVTEKDKSVKSIGGEVIVPASGESPEDISRASVVSEPNVIIGGDLNIVLPSKKIHSTFLALAITNGRLKKKLSSKAQGKSVVHIRNSDLADLDLILPTEYMEQTAISNYFQKLDTLINQHQQQITKLNNIKQACLSKMFV